MRLHYLQHVPFEDIANIGKWAEEKGHSVTRTLLFQEETLPQMDNFDWLIVMGGPMNIYQEKEYPWLIREKKFVEEAIRNGKLVLGVCLGAQLIAGVLGSTIRKNRHKEIGWFKVSLTPEATESPVFHSLPANFIAFHWHGDTFDIPPGCRRIAESEGCQNQAFEYEGRVIGLQFHLESSRESIKRLIENCADEIVEGKYIQTPAEMLRQEAYMRDINRTMNLLLDNMGKLASRGKV